MPYYAGIGSRETPWKICDFMEQIAKRLSQEGYVLRTGAAIGADTAFMLGASSKELFLPWPGYEGASGLLNEPTAAAYDLAKDFHPKWLSCGRGARALHARNGHIVLGPELNDPVEFVLCWTPDGSLGKTSARTGGTGQAIRLAYALDMQIYNLAREEHLNYWTKQRYVL